MNLNGYSSDGGGALLIKENAYNKYRTNEYIISHCLFQNCHGINGGALMFRDLENAMI